jgi:hypothetical protein
VNVDRIYLAQDKDEWWEHGSELSGFIKGREFID